MLRRQKHPAARGRHQGRCPKTLAATGPTVGRGEGRVGGPLRGRCVQRELASIYGILVETVWAVITRPGGPLSQADQWVSAVAALLVQLLEPDGSSIACGGQAVDDSVVAAPYVPDDRTTVAEFR
jgi:hypothetical protein